MAMGPRRSEQHAPPTPHQIPERVAEKAALSFVVDADGCHVSTYSTGSHGYGQLGWDDDITGAHTGTTAHRAAWTHWNGPIPQGMTIDHLCKNRRCVRRDHLRMLSNFDNARRTGGRDWPLGQCINGHPDSELVHWGGKWKCRVCTLERQRKKRGNSPRRSGGCDRHPPERYVNRYGKPRCLDCERESRARYRAKKRAERAA